MPRLSDLPRRVVRLAREGSQQIRHRVLRRLFGFRRPPGRPRLHIGCGRERLDGWINIDIQPLRQVDLCLNITRGLPFTDAELIFAEHFLEHLALDDAMAFLTNAHRALADDGRIRLSTPNLDWVWRDVYAGDTDRVRATLQTNRGFYGWQHRFLWDRPMLTAALESVGFSDLSWYRYGASDTPALRGLERHATYDDTSEHPHVLIVEAARGVRDEQRYERFVQRLHEHFLDFLDDSYR